MMLKDPSCRINLMRSEMRKHGFKVKTLSSTSDLGKSLKIRVKKTGDIILSAKTLQREDVAPTCISMPTCFFFGI